jgi:hypothetical protein
LDEYSSKRYKRRARDFYLNTHFNVFNVIKYMPEYSPGLFLNPSNGYDLCFGEGCDCSVYALYMSNCFGGYNNNMRIYVNGFYLGDFNASRDSSQWNGIPQNGAPEKCNHVAESSEFPFGQGTTSPNSCGGEDGRLFFINQPIPLSFPNFLPQGSEWPASLNFNNVRVTWHNAPITQGIVSIGESVPYELSNNLEMYFYTQDYHNGSFACCDSLGNKLFNMPIGGCPAGSEENPIYTCDNFPALLENTRGGCLGIIRYKKQNNVLTCPKFLPLEEVDAFRYGFVNQFPETINNQFYTQFSFNWWDESVLPVSNDPIPSWAGPIQYYW